MQAHANDARVAQMEHPVELRDGRCSWCGSMSVERAIELLKTIGTMYSGADWKYGYPHKFYIKPAGWRNADDGPAKFYAEHLIDATPEQLVEFDALCRTTLGISWARDERGVKYRAVAPGFQTSGVIGQAAAPHGAARVPDRWWA